MPFTKYNIKSIRKTYNKYFPSTPPEEVKDYMIKNFKNYFKLNWDKDVKALVMVSGGKDSSVVLKLACEAIGSKRVLAITAPFENDTSDILKTSLEVIEYCKIPKDNIIHSPIKANAKDGICNNNIDAIEDSLTGRYCEQVLTWDKNLPEDRNLAARIRMLKAYYFGQRFNSRVINTSNLSENIAGWFTKWGDCVGDYYPLKYYTASEVVLVGLELGIPEKFMFRVPDDGLIGTSDEDALGFTYNELDKEIWKRIHKSSNNAARYYDATQMFTSHIYHDLPEKMRERFMNAYHKRF